LTKESIRRRVSGTLNYCLWVCSSRW